MSDFERLEDCDIAIAAAHLRTVESLGFLIDYPVKTSESFSLFRTWIDRDLRGWE
jgi:hypothetical protein